MESPSAEDRPHPEAQEDSSSVDESRTSETQQSSPERLAEGETSRTREPALGEDSPSLTIASRLSRDEPADSSIVPKPQDALALAVVSADSEKPAGLLLTKPESSCANPASDSATAVDVDSRDVYEENFYSEEQQPTSSGESTPSRKRPAAEFLPISAEIKRIGVEISEEHAKQLKNDIRRLSPVLVSLRERTLGEISLTSDSGLYEDDNQAAKLEVREEEPSESLHLLGDTSGAVLTDSSLSASSLLLEDLPALVNCEKHQSEALDTSETSRTNEAEVPATPKARGEPKTASSDDSRLTNEENIVENVSSTEIQRDFPSSPVCSSNERLNGQRALVIVLSRVDSGGAESRTTSSTRVDAPNGGQEANGAVSSTSERTAAPCAVQERQDDHSMKEAARLELEAGVAVPEQRENASGEKDGLVFLGNVCLSPKDLQNDQLTRKSPKVVIERTLESVNAGVSPVKNSVDGTSEPSIRSDLECVRRSLVQELEDEADEDEATEEDPLRLASPDAVVETASDVQNSVDTETETETGSDSSELNSVSSIRLSDCAEPANGPPSCAETDSLVSDEVPSEIITRLEPERPEAYTEDSAESLALATGARDEVRSDGSDSGLGSEIPGDPGPAPAPESDSETSFLDRIPDDILSDKDKAVNPLEGFVSDAGTSGTQPQQQQQQQIPLPSFPSPPKSSLKRRLTDCMEGEPSPKRINTEDPMRKKRNIQFDAVTVYYFPRSQGFTCVPSQGGSTLGMSATHTHAERFSLAEHATEQRRIHRARLAQLRSERAANCVTEAASSSEDPSDDTDEEPSDTEELDIDSYYFLQPVPTWQRRALLRAAGVRRIDAVEKDECRDIRASREHCGCGCKGYCDPESCPCSRANVKCQVDRAGFPCGCSRDGCANSSGRIEFNPVRVRTHFIHTLMRLQLEKKQRDEDRTDHELSVNNQTGRGPMREVPDMMTSGLGPMDHPNVITGDPVSCINAGGFTTLHYDSHESSAASCQPIVHGGREDSLDLYAIRDDCYTAETEAVGVDATQNSQRKLHPEFGQAFQTFPGQQPDVSFPQGAYQDYQGYQNLASTSRSQFQPQFQAIPPASSGFSHYAYGQDPSVMQAACQAHTGPPHHHTVYETPFPQEDPNGSQQQYTNLNSVQPMTAVVQQMGKLEPFSELLAGRYSYYGEVEPQPIGGYHSSASEKIETEKSPIVGQEPAESAEDCDENFGEIIKKSMVETVSA